MKRFTDEYLEAKWRELEDVPFDEDEDGSLYLAEDWWIFGRGDYRDEVIWVFFDEHHSKGLHYLLYELNN